MFTWGEDCRRGFWLKDERADARGAGGTAAGVHRVNLGCHVRDVSAGHDVLAFVKANGNAFTIRTRESPDGSRARGRQKFVKCKEKIQAVSCEDDVVYLLSEQGSVLCVDTTNTPRPLEALRNVAVSQVACGSHHSVALTRDGQVFTWGQDSRGQLGLGKRKLGVGPPQRLRPLSEIPLVQVAAGGEQSFALSVSGGVFAWGRNDRGQLGLGDRTDRTTPTAIGCLNMKKTCHVSCGKDHTATLTKDGAVFTFGSGQHGQLGHNSFRDELRPRLVAELWGAKVVQVACGSHHTLAMTDSRRVYSFGRWLGRTDETHPSVPLPVQLPQDGDSHQITSIYAGGNCSFATCPSNETADSVSNGTQSLDDVIGQWNSECGSKSWKKTKLEIRRMFSSASYLNKSFLEHRKDKHFQTSPKYHGLNLSLARRGFKKLVEKDDVLIEVEDSVLALLQSLHTKPVGVEALRIHLLLMELLHVMQKQQRKSKLVDAVAAAVLRLSAESLQVIGGWWSSLSRPTMGKYLKVWKKALSALLSQKPVPRDSRVRNLLLVLQYMYDVNSRIAGPQRIPERDFCLLTDKEFLKEELLLWRQRHRRGSEEPLILCRFPMVLDLQSKSSLFVGNAFYSKMESMFQGFWNIFFNFEELLELILPCWGLRLHLRRDETLLTDTFRQLAAVRDRDYKKPLIVCFDENPEVDDVNVKDFFHEVFHKLTSVKDMFMFNDSETLAWFPSNVGMEHQRYFLLGVLCGLALYNQCIIHLPFPLVLFKKLLDRKPSLDDMIEFNPCQGRNLKNILEMYEDDVIKHMDIDFSMYWDGKVVDLDPKNPERPVTGQNRKEFVEACVNYAFNTSVDDVFQDFKRGFFRVCDRDLVKLFKPEELQGVLAGKDFHDWTKLKENTGYEGGYHVEHPTIQMFWEVFDELSEQQKRNFLLFVTGFERAPVLGMRNITIAVGAREAEDHSYDLYYPETHTCFSKLELPLYSSKETMRTMLTEALSRATTRSI